MRVVNYIPYNTVSLLFCGNEYFAAIESAFDAAEFEIYLETYIFAADETGERIKAALKRAASRGVDIRIIVDWLGTGHLQSAALAKEFRAANIHYRAFNPWFDRGITRSHRKICVVDQQVAFVGGLNINDDLRCDFDNKIILPAPRWDMAVKIEGPLVMSVQQEVESQWARLTSLNLKLHWKIFRAQRRAQTPVAGSPALAALVVRDNLRNRRTIQRAYLQALGHAKHSAMLANPYFAPGRKLRDALVTAAKRGVDVTILLGVGQFYLQDAVAHAFYPKLLESGVKIVEYQKTQLHGKVAVIDDAWSTVGSSNYDGLSLFVNQEANIFIKDVEFTASLRAHIETAVKEGVQIRAEDFANIPWYKRVWYWTAFRLYRATIRIITWGNYT